LYKNVSNYYKSLAGFVSIAAIEFGIGLVPVIVFLITNDPHDCFMCLGKDPLAGAYSSYQKVTQVVTTKSEPYTSTVVKDAFISHAELQGFDMELLAGQLDRTLSEDDYPLTTQ